MLGLITGVPGSGKSLLAVEMIHKQIEANKDPKALPYEEWVKQYQIDEDGFLEPIIEDPQPLIRPIFSDIRGLSFPEVEKAPYDWRDCPDGSIIFYDECQKKYGPDGQGRSKREDIQKLEEHRHRGFDIFLITQHPKLLHAHIRRLVGRHYHVHRLFGSQSATVYQKEGQIDVDKPTSLSKQDSFAFSYPKKLFKYYKSATIHTHKRHIPNYLKKFVWVAVGLIGVMVYFIPTAWSFIFPDEQTTDQTKVEEPSKQIQQAEINITDKPAPVACVSNDEKCVCYDNSGYKLDIPYQFCKKFTEQIPVFLDIRPNGTKRADAT